MPSKRLGELALAHPRTALDADALGLSVKLLLRLRGLHDRPGVPLCVVRRGVLLCLFRSSADGRAVRLAGDRPPATGSLRGLVSLARALPRIVVRAGKARLAPLRALAGGVPRCRGEIVPQSSPGLRIPHPCCPYRSFVAGFTATAAPLSARPLFGHPPADSIHRPVSRKPRGAPPITACPGRRDRASSGLNRRARKCARPVPLLDDRLLHQVHRSWKNANRTSQR